MGGGRGRGGLATREALALADLACPLVLQHGLPLCAGGGDGGGEGGGVQEGRREGGPRGARGGQAGGGPGGTPFMSIHGMHI